MHGAAGLAEAVAGERRGTVEVFAGPRGVVGRGDGLELGDDPGQALREGVMDLGGQPAPLVGHPGLPCLEQQLGVQGGVLGEGLFQPGVGEFQLGDGLGLAPGPLRLAGADVAEEQGEGGVQDEEGTEGRPVGEGGRGIPLPDWEPAMVTAVHSIPARAYRFGSRSPTSK